MKRTLIALAALGTLLLLLGAALLFGLQFRSDPGADQASAAVADPARQIARGAYLVRAGDCMACHTVRGGAEFAGGRPIATPFGALFSPNITPDIATGIGAWSANDFWRALHDGGFTPRVLLPWEQATMLACGIGITNLVRRATATAAELDDVEIRAGRRALERKVRRYRPAAVAVVGIGAYRVAFDRPKATLGEQPELIEGARLWVLPNTSGLNANHQAKDFASAFGALRSATVRTRSAARSRRG